MFYWNTFRLLYAGHGIMGLGHVIRQGQAPPQHTLNCTLIQSDGTLKTFSVPFHCALRWVYLQMLQYNYRKRKVCCKKGGGLCYFCIQLRIASLGKALNRNIFFRQRIFWFLFHQKKCLKLQALIFSKLTFQFILNLILSLNSMVD